MFDAHVWAWRESMLSANALAALARITGKRRQEHILAFLSNLV